MNSLFFGKVRRVLVRKADALAGRLYSLPPVLESMALRPFELHLEFTNLCNADCVFCPYQFQTREASFMPDEVFHKAVSDYVAMGGGSVGLTPVVGDALIEPRFVERVRYLRSLPSIDRIWITTNAILLDKHGVAEVLDSGLTAIAISTAGFQEEMYRRVYRNASYQRMRRNVLELLRLNAARRDPVAITIALRPDRPLDQVMQDPDFQPVLQYRPMLDFTWSYTSANGRITRQALPQLMKLRVVTSRPEPCVNLYNGPIVLPGGEVMGCSCVAAMDAVPDLGIGNILETSLQEIWIGPRMRDLRAGFSNGELNPICAGCDMYSNLDLYRTREGRQRAELNRARHEGRSVDVGERRIGPFSGG